MRTMVGFEVLVAGRWVSVPALSATSSTVTIGSVPAAASKLRYNWFVNGTKSGPRRGNARLWRARVLLRGADLLLSPSPHCRYSNPCGEHCFGCAVYVKVNPIGVLSGEESFLPLPPFVLDL